MGACLDLIFWVAFWKVLYSEDSLLAVLKGIRGFFSKGLTSGFLFFYCKIELLNAGWNLLKPVDLVEESEVLPKFLEKLLLIEKLENLLLVLETETAPYLLLTEAYELNLLL